MFSFTQGRLCGHTFYKHFPRIWDAEWGKGARKEEDRNGGCIQGELMPYRGRKVSQVNVMYNFLQECAFVFCFTERVTKLCLCWEEEGMPSIVLLRKLL